MKGEILKKDIIQKEVIQIKYRINKNFKPMLKRLSKLLLQIGYEERNVRIYEIEKSLNVSWNIAENKNRRCSVFENLNHRIVVTRELTIIYPRPTVKHLEDYIGALKFITHRILENECTTIEEMKFEIQTLDYVDSLKDIQDKYNYLSIKKDNQDLCKSDDKVSDDYKTENQYSDKDVIYYRNEKESILYKMVKYKIDKYNGIEFGNVIANISASYVEEIRETVLNNLIYNNINELKSICYEILKKILKETYIKEIDFNI
ncbi:MAG: hypothetical protein J6A15_02185 [Clostridia bacterium]|nr:hypothetical protein [Clostridia bacterium]